VKRDAHLEAKGSGNQKRGSQSENQEHCRKEKGSQSKSKNLPSSNDGRSRRGWKKPGFWLGGAKEQKKKEESGAEDVEAVEHFRRFLSKNGQGKRKQFGKTSWVRNLRVGRVGLGDS